MDHLHGAGALCLEALHGVREETGEVLLDTLFGGEGETCIGRWLVMERRRGRGEEGER